MDNKKINGTSHFKPTILCERIFRFYQAEQGRKYFSGTTKVTCSKIKCRLTTAHRRDDALFYVRVGQDYYEIFDSYDEAMRKIRKLRNDEICD